MSRAKIGVIGGSGFIGSHVVDKLLDDGHNVKIFDIYQGQNITSGKKSIAFSVTLEPRDKTLSENDIDQISKKIISTIKESTNATLRS